MTHARTSLRQLMVLTIFIVILPILFSNNQNPETISAWQGKIKWLGFILMLGLAGSFWILTKNTQEQPKPIFVLLLVAFQFITVFLFSAELMFFLAFELPLVLNRKAAKRWITFFILTFFAVWLLWLPASAPNYLDLLSDVEFRIQIKELTSIIAFILFAFLIGSIIKNESSMRAQLEIAQSKLQEKTKIAERHAISRELHDCLGHHLVTLKVQLELIQRHAPNIMQSKLLIAKEITQTLINDLRGVVDEMKESELAPLHTALNNMLSGIVNPKVSLSLPPQMPNLTSEVQKTLYRCIQECLTNTIKHSHASTLDIKIEHKENVLKVKIRDNGKGAKNLKFGNGLSGLIERTQLINGKIEFNTGINQGFSATLTIPTKKQHEYRPSH